MRVREKVTTKPRGAPFWPSLYLHRDTEVESSAHADCGSPIRCQHLRSVPPVITDETAIVTAEGQAWVYYCPRCDVRVDDLVTLYETATERT